MMSNDLHWAYVAVAHFEDGPPEEEVIRFPSPAWWAVSVAIAASRLATRNGPFRLKNGNVLRRKTDGSVEEVDPSAYERAYERGADSAPQ